MQLEAGYRIGCVDYWSWSLHGKGAGKPHADLVRRWVPAHLLASTILCTVGCRLICLPPRSCAQLDAGYRIGHINYKTEVKFLERGQDNRVLNWDDLPPPMEEVTAWNLAYDLEDVKRISVRWLLLFRHQSSNAADLAVHHRPASSWM